MSSVQLTTCSLCNFSRKYYLSARIQPTLADERWWANILDFFKKSIIWYEFFKKDTRLVAFNQVYKIVYHKSQKGGEKSEFKQVVWYKKKT